MRSFHQNKHQERLLRRGFMAEPRGIKKEPSKEKSIKGSSK